MRDTDCCHYKKGDHLRRLLRMVPLRRAAGVIARMSVGDRSAATDSRFCVRTPFHTRSTCGR